MTDKEILLKLIRNLRLIKETGKAPINLVRYKKLGLIKVYHKTRTPGMGALPYQALDRLVLTEKGKQILNSSLLVEGMK